MSNANKSNPIDSAIFVLLTVIASLLLVLIFVVASKNNPKKGGVSQDQASSSSSSSSEWVNKKAPDFDLEDFEGNKVSPASLKGKNVVLFFTEGLMCYPACWDQMAKLGTDGRFNDEKTVAYSVIIDPKSEWKKAFDKMPELRKTKVLFDVYRTASRSYNALNVTSSMHQGSFPGHTYYLIDKEGIIRYYYDDPQMGIRNDLIYEELKKIQ